MGKYILSLIGAMISMFIIYGLPVNWTFGDLLNSFLIAFFVNYHLDLLKTNEK